MNRRDLIIGVGAIAAGYGLRSLAYPVGQAMAVPTPASWINANEAISTEVLIRHCLWCAVVDLELQGFEDALEGLGRGIREVQNLGRAVHDITLIISADRAGIDCENLTVNARIEQLWFTAQPHDIQSRLFLKANGREIEKLSGEFNGLFRAYLDPGILPSNQRMIVWRKYNKNKLEFNVVRIENPFETTDDDVSGAA